MPKVVMQKTSTKVKDERKMKKDFANEIELKCE